MTKILVTGGLGFIGSEFVNLVKRNSDHKVIVLDKYTYAADESRIEGDLSDLTIIKGDICDINQLCYVYPELYEVEYVVNFAAETHVDNSISDGTPFMHTNVMGVYNLLEYARGLKNLKKFVQISTDEVYGDMAECRGENGADESFNLRPSSYYAASKASADMLVMAAARTYGVPYLITRTCNNYGEKQDKEKLIPKIMESIVNDSVIPVYGDGQQTREWIHVEDNAKIQEKLIFADNLHTTNSIVNVGSGTRFKNIDIVNFLQRAKPDVKWSFVPDRKGHDREYALNCEKLRSIIGPYEKDLFPFSAFLMRVAFSGKLGV